MTTPPAEIKLENYTPVRLVWGVLKSDGTMEGRMVENKKQEDEVKLLFSDYRVFKLIEIK